MSSIRLDHVTLAGRDLQVWRDALAAVGLPTVYGGRHSNGQTHMALAGFADGSYLEVISAVGPGPVDPGAWWAGAIEADGGACAWALQVEELDQEVARVKAAGVPVRGPHEMDRRRPDGRRAVWRLAFLGEGQPGQLLPFLIEDRTDRQLRVPEQARVPAPILGVDHVVIGAKDLPAALHSIDRWHPCRPESPRSDPFLQAELVELQGLPLALAEPRGPDSWLARRLARDGTSPCAFVFAVESTEFARRAGVDVHESGTEVVWVRPGAVCQARLGFVARPVSATP